MSAPGPEAIPLSADPRRTTKKRAADAHANSISLQASQLESLFARPDQEIRIPSGPPDPKRRLPIPPEIVTNVQGSSAGAGSGEFHVYKAARRREYERLRIMDEEVKREEEQKEFEVKKQEHEEGDRKKTDRNRAKREKMKARKEKAKAAVKKNGSGKHGDDVLPQNGGVGGGGVKARTIPTRDAEQGDEAGNDKMVVDSEDGVTQQTAAVAANEPGLLIHDDD